MMAESNSGHSGCRKVSRANMLNYIMKREVHGRGNDPQKLKRMLWGSAKNLYRKDLAAHFGCVNAIEFSSDGNLLFSGGDDRRVLMWNVDAAMMRCTGKYGDAPKPKIMRACHFSNIFCLAVDDGNKRVLSGSNDDQVIVHDYNTGVCVDYFMHDSPVFSVSLHPVNGNIFASAADNGRILVYDIRESNSSPLCLAKFRNPFHGVMFNPFAPFLIATANSKVGVHIWDLRKPRQVLEECSKEQSMAVRWNQNGTILLALRNLLPPIIYNPFRPKKNVEFDAEGYYNACTMKSCSFAGDNDEYIISGSDDFNLYMWKIPEPWPRSKWVPEAQLTLTGHRSIVNQVRYEPNKQVIASSGVEKIIKIWSPFRMPYSEGDVDKPCPKRTRFLCSSRACARSPGLLNYDYIQESIEEDTRMIHFFDSLLRNELHGTTPSSFSQFFCVDGKSIPIASRKRDAKPYEHLILRKRKHLTKLLTGREDDRPSSLCCLSDADASRQSREAPTTRKRCHFALPESELLTSLQEESDGQEIGSGRGHGRTASPASSEASSSSLSSASSSSSSSSASSSSSSSSSTSTSFSASSSTSGESNGRLVTVLNSPYRSESSEESNSDANSRASREESPYDLTTPRRRFFSEDSTSEDSVSADSTTESESKKARRSGGRKRSRRKRGGSASSGNSSDGGDAPSRAKEPRPGCSNSSSSAAAAAAVKSRSSRRKSERLNGGKGTGSRRLRNSMRRKKGSGRTGK